MARGAAVFYFCQHFAIPLQPESGLVVTEKPGTKTGYEFICNVDPEGRYPFQARIKVKVDGATRGTLRTLPGLFKTALEAAQYRALLLQQGGQDCLGAPRKHRSPASLQAISHTRASALTFSVSSLCVMSCLQDRRLWPQARERLRSRKGGAVANPLCPTLHHRARCHHQSRMRAVRRRMLFGS